MDLSRAGDRDAAAFCRQGYGALLAKLAEGIPVQLDTRGDARRHRGRGNRVELSTTEGRDRRPLHASSPRRPTSGAGPHQVRRRPAQAPAQDALEKLKLGSFDHIALELTGNPLGLQRDDLVFEKSSGPRTAALLANVGGTPLSVVSVGGRFGRDLAAQGDKAMVEFAVEWLSGHVRRQRQEGGAAHADDAMEQGAMDAGRDRGGVARLAGCAPHPDGADPQPRVLRRRGGARNAVGHGRRRLGVRHPRGRRGGPPRLPASPTSAEAARSPSRRHRRGGSAGSHEWPSPGADRLVERQGQRLGAARDAARGDGRGGRRADHGHQRHSAASASMACARSCCGRSSTPAACRPPSCGFRIPARTRSTSARWRRRWLRPRPPASPMWSSAICSCQTCAPTATGGAAPGGFCR